MLIKIAVAVLIGAFAGFAAGKIMGTKDRTFWMNALLGILGGAVGGFLGSLIGLGDGWISSILLSIGGSCLLIWLARKLSK